MHKPMIAQMRELPMFPLMPILPLTVMITLVAFSILNYRSLKKVETKLNKIYHSPSLAVVR